MAVSFAAVMPGSIEIAGRDDGGLIATPSGALSPLSVEGVPKALAVIFPFCPTAAPMALTFAGEMPVESP